MGKTLKLKRRAPASANPLKVEIAACEGEVDLPASAFTSFHDTQCVLEPSGRRCFLVSAQGDHAFIGVWDVRAARLREVVCFRAHFSMGFPDVLVDDERLSIVAWDEWLELSTLTWDLLRRRRIPELEDEDDCLVSDLFTPGLRFRWLAVERERQQFVRVVDLERRRVCRELEVEGMPELLPGPTPRVFVPGYGEGGGLFDPSGAYSAPAFCSSCTAAAVHPLESGLILARESSDVDRLLAVAAMDDDGETSPVELLLPGSESRTHHQIATSLTQELSFVLHRGEGVLRLVAVAPNGPGWDLAYRMRVPHGSALVQDIHARRVALALAGRNGVTVQLLSKSPPLLSAQDLDGDGLPSDDPWVLRTCRAPRDASARDAVHAIQATSSKEARARLRKTFLEEHAFEPERLTDFADAVEALLTPEEYSDVWAFVETHWDDHPAVLLRRAEGHAHESHWADVLSCLSRPHRGDLSAAGQLHARHLLALARLRLGDLAGARTCLAERPPLEDDRCGLAAWAAWVDALSAPLVGKVLSAEASRPRRLVAAIREADARLDAGDAPNALGLLDGAGIFCIPDLQCLARYVAAFLQHDHLTGTDLFRARLALTRFLRERADPRFLPRPWGTCELTDDELDSLRDEAEAWLMA